MIIESIITTVAADGRPHIAPMGVIWRDGRPILAPFLPSTTLDNLRQSGAAVINHTDDVRIFAGCLTGRRDWALRPATRIAGHVLEAALTHQEVEVERVDEDPVRPRFLCRVVHEETHGGFRGFNRAQAAVIEAAILVSRLHLLPREKIDSEIAYLTIAVEKTAGAREREAWSWLTQAIATFNEAARSAGINR
jgi:uncharacterized protein